MTIAAAYGAGCSMVAIAAHQPPADSLIVAQDAGSGATLKGVGDPGGHVLSEPGLQ